MVDSLPTRQTGNARRRLTQETVEAVRHLEHAERREHAPDEDPVGERVLTESQVSVPPAAVLGELPFHSHGVQVYRSEGA